MTAQQLADLKQTVAAFQSLLDAHRRARERLIERRADAHPSQVAKLDQAIAINGCTLEAMKNALELLQRELQEMELRAS